MESSETFLKQKIEFMQAELEQYKKKEMDQSKLNESLILFLGKSEESCLSVRFMQTHTINEYKKTVETQRKEIQDLRLRHKDEVMLLEKELNQMRIENKEFEFRLKQQRLTLDAEKLDMMNKFIKLEADKISVEKDLKTRQSELIQSQTFQQLQLETKISDTQRKLETINQEHLNEIKKVRQEADKAVVEIKVIYEEEIQSLKEQLVNSQGRVRELLKEVEGLQECSHCQVLKEQVLVLEDTLEQYKMLVRQGAKGDKEEFRSFNSDFLGSKDSCRMSSIKKADEEWLGMTYRVPAEYQKFVTEIERLRAANAKVMKDKEEGEKKMRSEIKYLIGKLLKAKSKISAEGELTGHMRRESMMNTLRSSGLDRLTFPFKSSQKLSKDL